VHELIPRDKTVQKIMRNLQSVAADASEMARMGDAAAIIKRAERSGARMDDVRVFLTVLRSGGQIQDYDRETNGLRETYLVAPVKGDKDVDFYLEEVMPVVEEIDRKIDQVSAARIAVINRRGDQPGFETRLKELNGLLSAAFAVSDKYSLAVAAAYARNSSDIGFDFLCTFLTVVVVLVIATVLLVLFTFWLSNSITLPIKSITGQIRSLGEGDISSLKKIEITSKDEIGILTQEFNGLMDSISSLTSFKKIIEEDDSIEDVYLRLAHKFKHDFGLDEMTIYEIANSQNKMRAVYPLEVSPENLYCNGDILSDCLLCRAKKTGHEISSFFHPGMCKSFLTSSDREYFCLPLIMGGVTGGVVQFLFSKGGSSVARRGEIEKTVFKARQYIAESVSVIDAKRLMNTLKDSALKDSLTGLYNRRFLQEYTESLVAGVLRREKQVGLIMCDLDYFKQINDLYGHNTGDAVLKETARVIKNSIRSSDLVIRFGGEEFLVVLLDIKTGETTSVAEKIRGSIENTKLKVPDGVIRKTISLGISEFPADTDSFWQAIKYADVALYKAKESGRNKSLRFAKDMWKEQQF
jgi:diguanylate cyclase (GGDEF)-like protein